MNANYCWLILGALILAIAGGMFVFYRRQQSWRLQDEHRQMEILKLRRAAAESAVEVEKALKSVGEAQGEIIILETKLEDARKKVSARKKPETLGDCEDQLRDTDAYVLLLEDSLALERTVGDALQDALGHQQTRAELLERAWQVEHKRAEAAHKQIKREKIKKAFLAIGVGLAGGATGYAIGVTR